MTIFYSWQSNIENQRSQIQKTLESSIKKIKKEISLDICIDRDTKGQSGAVNIVNSIFNKINSCRIFVADISFINTYKDEKFVNQNVLIELGYAIRKLGFENIILLFNLNFGKIEELPFDISQNRVLSYKTYEELENKIVAAIKGILKNQNTADLPNRDLDDFHDTEVFKRFLEIFPETTYKNFLEHFWSTGKFKRSESDFLDETVLFSKDPKNIFLNQKVKNTFSSFIKCLDKFRCFTAEETFPCNGNNNFNELKTFDYLKDYTERDKEKIKLRNELNEEISEVKDSYTRFRETVVKELRV